MKHVIIGNGVAGTEAALAIRKSDAQASITVVSESPHHYFYRPRVIEYLAGETTTDKLVIYKQDFYDKNRIETRLGTRVTDILTGEHVVLDAKGTRLEWDRLLIATGARSFMPPVRGSDLAGVFTLRGISDADLILDYAKGVEHVAVIGGGLLGLEAAYSLSRLGKTVTVIEFFQWLLPRQLDQAGGRILLEMLESKGLSFILGDSVASIEGDGRVGRLVLKSGKEVQAGMVLVSAGIRCSIDLAKAAGIETNTGIIVDDHLRTSAPGVFAAGDPVEHRGKVYGIWPAAREQGRIAGLNMAGIETAYEGTIMANSLKITGIDLFSAGDFNAKECEILVSEGAGSYRKLCVDLSNPLGAIVLGDPEAVKVAQKIMEGKAKPEEMKRFF
jgi:nitrite reductase (NADH) large subunit